MNVCEKAFILHRLMSTLCKKGLKSYIILLTLQVFMSFQRCSIDKLCGVNSQVRKWLLILSINLLVLCIFWLFGFLCCVPMLMLFSSFKKTTKAYWSLTFNDGSTSSISSGTLWVPTWCQKRFLRFFPTLWPPSPAIVSNPELENRRSRGISQSAYGCIALTWQSWTDRREEAL